jgi:hypothetical protein
MKIHKVPFGMISAGMTTKCGRYIQWSEKYGFMPRISSFEKDITCKKCLKMIEK